MSKESNTTEKHPLKEGIDSIIQAGKNIGQMYKHAGVETAEAYRDATQAVVKKFTDTI